MDMTSHLPPELDVTEWIGTPTPLASVRGRVVLVEAFQMLCPGCVTGSLPQARKAQRLFPDLVVIGLHTVFEHHDVTGPDALRVFLSEFGYDFPVGVDRHDGHALPNTMRRYRLQGTPSTLLFDRVGRLRLSHFGAIDDLALGGVIGRLLQEEKPSQPTTSAELQEAAVATGAFVDSESAAEA